MENLLEIVWDRIALVNERYVVVGWSLAVGFSCGRSHGVIQGGNIYKCSNDG